MRKTYVDRYRSRRLGKLGGIVVLGIGVFLWKQQRWSRSSQDAWTASILHHVLDREQSREAQQEQMKKAFRLAETAGTQKRELFHAYQRFAGDSALSRKPK